MISRFFSLVSKEYETDPNVRRKVKIRFLLIIGFAVLLGFIWVGSVYWKNSRTMKTLTVEGNSEVAKEEIIKLAALKSGVQLMSVSPSVVKNRLTKNPMIETAIVKVELPGTLKIKVTERTPLAKLSGERFGMLDGRGYGMPEMKKKFFDLPVITGIKEEDFDEKWGLAKNKQLIKVANFLKHAQREYPVIYYLISEIRLVNDQSFQIYTQDGAVPLLMNYDNALVQMVYFNEFYKQVVQILGSEKFKYVDLRADQIITAKEI